MTTPDQILDDLLATYRPEVVEAVAELALGRIARDRRAAALVVPHDPSLEAAVLGAGLMSERCLDAALATGWSHEACYLPAHRRLTLGLLEVYGDGAPIDDRTCCRVLDHLDAQGRLLPDDGLTAIDAIAAACPSPPGVAVDAARLVELSRRREAFAEAAAVTAAWKGAA